MRSLPPEKQLALAKALTPKLTKYIPHKPHPKQQAFLLVPNREALFGGAAGGGKSDAMLMAALQYVDVPGYAALILRRRYTDLTKADGLIPRSHEWLAGTDAKWKEQTHCWTFPSGATLEFGHMENENDRFNYQGSAWQFIGFEELTQFTLVQYTYLLSRRRRRTGAPVPLRTRASANPGGVGHDWVKQRFIVEGPKNGRVFVPSKLEDNPSLDRAEYEEALKELDPVTRAQLRHGDWDMRIKGPYFDRKWFKIVEGIEPNRIHRVRWVRYWDLAATEPHEANKDPDWTSGTLMGEVDNDFFIADVRKVRKNSGEVEQLVKDTAHEDRERWGGGVETWIEQEPGSAGKKVAEEFTSDVLKGFAAYANKETGDKLNRAKPLSAAAFNGKIHLLPGAWHSDLFAELEAFPTKGVHDDQVDSTSGAYGQLNRFGAGEMPDVPEQEPKEFDFGDDRPTFSDM